MTYGMDPDDMDRVYRAAMSHRARVRRGILVILLLAIFVCIALLMVR